MATYAQQATSEHMVTAVRRALEAERIWMQQHASNDPSRGKMTRAYAEVIGESIETLDHLSAKSQPGCPVKSLLDLTLTMLHVLGEDLADINAGALMFTAQACQQALTVSLAGVA